MTKFQPLTQGEYNAIRQRSEECRAHGENEHAGSRVEGKGRYAAEYERIRNALRFYKVFEVLKAANRDIMLSEIGPGFKRKKPIAGAADEQWLGIKTITEELTFRDIPFKVLVVDSEDKVLKQTMKELRGLKAKSVKLNLIYDNIPGESDLCNCVNVLWNTNASLEMLDIVLDELGWGDLVYRESHAIFDNIVQSVRPGGFLAIDQVPREKGDMRNAGEALEDVDLKAYELDYLGSALLRPGEKAVKKILIFRKMKDVKMWKS